MQIFVSGTDTNIGKTLICSWLCLHSGHSYFKPIQTGTEDGYDSSLVKRLSGAVTYAEVYSYKKALSPHLASSLENQEIDISKIILPHRNIIVEGAGGLMVPLNKKYLMIDLIKNLNIPVIIVTKPSIGTINHTLLSIEALYNRKIRILGIIMSGEPNSDNSHSIEFYGKVNVLAEFPFIDKIDRKNLQNIPFTKNLEKIFT